MEHEQAFKNLKEVLVQDPILTLSNISKPSQLYVHERKDIAKGALTQILGPWKRLIAYISQRLDPAAFGWPPCLAVIAARAILVEADKFTLVQILTKNSTRCGSPSERYHQPTGGCLMPIWPSPSFR